jgi:NAD(P)-dependent dehydrogenase (short-subunit alcohol dehydrogenase family)
MQDPVTLITGATGPLGRVVAAAFAEDGARLGLAGSDLDRLRSLAADLQLPEGLWVPAVGDLRDPDDVRSAVDAVIERFGRVDVLLHLVGGWAGGTAVVDLDLDEVRTMLDQHLWTTMHAVRAVLPGMVERGWGRIVAVSTPFAADPGPKGASYAIAKAAEETLLRTVAREVSGSGVTANLVVVKKIDADHARETDPSPKNAAWTAPEEIAATMRFLCSDAAAAVNGARIPLHGRG